MTTSVGFVAQPGFYTGWFATGTYFVQSGTSYNVVLNVEVDAAAPMIERIYVLC